MHVLITGGAGFIGSHLLDHHVAAGDTVTILDDLSTGHVHNIQAALSSGAANLVQGCVTNATLVEGLVKRADCVYHLASAVGVQRVMTHRIRTIDIAVSGTHAVLEAAARDGTPVLIASTSEVYGKITQMPLREDNDPCIGPSEIDRWGYACAKLVDEFMAIAYFKECALPVVVVRLFNTIGPRQVGQYGMVVPRFVEAAITGREIHIHGSGEQTRCFTHVHDVVRSLSTLLATPASYGTVFNIGSNEEISIKDLATLVKDVVDAEVPVRHISHQDVFGDSFQDIDRRVPDCSRLQRTIGFVPSTPLRKSITDVAAAMRPASILATT